MINILIPIKVINRYSSIYLAEWENSPLCWNKNKYERDTNIMDRMVNLKYLYNSQNITKEFLNNEIKQYSMSFIENNNIPKIYGISQDPDTKKYMMVLQDGYCRECGGKYAEIKYKSCILCHIKKDLGENFSNRTSKNEKIDEFIQEIQLEINDRKGIIFEWIPCDQFNNIKEIGRNLYSALWENGPLMYDLNEKKWIRVEGKEVKLYNNIFKMHGITQNSDSKDYVMVLQHEEYVESYCKTCIEEYTDIKHRWCKLCQIDYLRKYFTNWSGNEKIDEFIQEIQLRINHPNDIVFEWIPYNQFMTIEEIGKGGFATVYSAIWKNGLLHYDKEWKRGSDKKVALKCIESQNVTDEFLNEIKAYSMNKCGSNIIKIYGISQDPSTKNYILVLQYAEGRNFNNWMNKCYKDFDWDNKIRTLYNIIIGLNEIHKKGMVHRDFHTGNILFEYGYVNKYNDTYISDMGLCGEIGNADKSKIYGVMSYMAPEQLEDNPLLNESLALDICYGIKPKLDELEAPRCYIEIMQRCLDSDPYKRPDAAEIEDIIYSYNFSLNEEIKKQFEEAEEYRKANLLPIEIIQSATHPQAINTSRLLNPYLPKCDNNVNSECLDCTI
ncbi:kinase-like domain-containing protein [Rhizophagus clarus]|uniref:Kinase-like domain-containing protein n=1 Tax=Rhizophagus clarus TaxID=94130 RepID=A0A8H3L5J0_9GLOM|nr:kinase-like domain-containing protein [Rhizophagus clarus]